MIRIGMAGLHTAPHTLAPNCRSAFCNIVCQQEGAYANEKGSNQKLL